MDKMNIKNEIAEFESNIKHIAKNDDVEYVLINSKTNMYIRNNLNYETLNIDTYLNQVIIYGKPVLLSEEVKDFEFKLLRSI